MFVEEIYLSNFRNYEKGYTKFSESINVIYGDNARGKTNILEAIYLLSTARSHRLAKEIEMIMFGKQNAKINAKFNSHKRDNIGEIMLFSDKKKQIKINKVPIDRASQLMGFLNVVMFCPEDLRLVKGAPKERRRMIDLGICQLRQKYFHSLSQYGKILEQRNKLLKDNPNSESLWVWNEKLVETGSNVIWFRNNYLNRLTQRAKEIHFDICKENLEIEYDCGVNITNFEDKASIISNFSLEINKNLEREKRFGISLTGPHRDDFKISINGKEARLFASQGQQRTAALSLKMAEVALIENDTGETPILLLDDVLSELDDSRQNYILQNIKGIQVIITCTHKDKFDIIGEVNKINVEGVRL